MKKFIISLAVSLALTIGVQAQNHARQSFFAGGISSVTVSNTLQVTNLLYSLSNGTNAPGVTYTNGTTQVVAGSADYKNLLTDVSLWSDREGRAFSQTTTNVTDPSWFNTPASLCIKTISQSGANAAVTLVFSPVMNDKVGEETITTEYFTASITPTASSTQVWRVSVPLYKWPGAKKLRLMYVNNADTDATSNVKITELSLNGYVP